MLPWNAGSRRLFAYAAGELGVRLDVPYRELTRKEREIVLHGETVQRRVTFQTGSGRTVSLNVNYENAVAAAERGARSENERGRRQAAALPGLPGVLGLPRHPAATRGAELTPGRPQHR